MRKDEQARAPQFWLEALERRALLSAIPAAQLIHTTAALSASRLNIAAATAGDDVLFAGGGDGLSASTVVDIFDDGSGQWSTTALPDGDSTLAAGSGASVYFLGGSDRKSQIYDTATGQWSIVDTGSLSGSKAFTLPDGRIVVVGVKTDALFDPTTDRATTILFGEVCATDGTDVIGSTGATPGNVTINIIDTLSGKMNPRTLPIMASGGFLAEAIGNSVLFVSDNGGGAVPTTAYLLNTITSRGSAVTVPTELRVLTSTFPNDAAVIGSKALFADAEIVGPTGQTEADVVPVFDLATGQWSQAPINPGNRQGVAVAAVDDKVLMAGGAPGNPYYAISQVDIYQDENPMPELQGGTAARAKAKTTVVLQNTGDADFTGPYTVQVYAIPPRQYHGAILLGSQVVNGNLAAGDSLRFSIPINTANVPAGTYHLVAMVKAADGTLTPFAGATENFTIGKSASAKPAIALQPKLIAAPMIATSVPNPWLSDSTNILD